MLLELTFTQPAVKMVPLKYVPLIDAIFVLIKKVD